jgi:hypothetical protein
MGDLSQQVGPRPRQNPSYLPILSYVVPIRVKAHHRKEALLFGKRSKNFCLLRCALDATRALMSKSFLVLFFKKELLAFPTSQC